MFKSYFLVAVRNILKNRLFSAINIMGLSIGLSAVMLIALYIWDEYTFDKYLGTNENIHKLELKTNLAGVGARSNPVTAGSIAIGLLADLPELVENTARIHRATITISVGDRLINEEVHYADASFFEVFDIQYANGNAATASPNLSTVALSETVANNYYGAGGALGKTLLLDNGKSYQVGAVYKDFPENTHIRPKLIFPIEPSIRDSVADDAGWWRMGYSTYVQLKPGKTAADLKAVLPAFIDRHREELEPGVAMSEIYGFDVLPLADVHFNTAAPNVGNPLLLKGFAAIALVILSIATFNFMSMSISRTISRTREVAVRKIFGAKAGDIIGLFMSETVLTVLASFLIALVITEVSLKWFNELVSKLMSMDIFLSPLFTVGIIGLVVFVALGAGFYPAFAMTKLRPATVLGGGRSQSKNMSRLGAILVTVQFSVAIALIITTTIVYQQIQYSQSMDPGYKKENLVLLHGLNHPSVNPSVQVLKQRLLNHPDIYNVSLTDQAPGGTFGWYEGIQNVNGQQLDQSMSIRGMGVDKDFVPTYGMRLVAGRLISEERIGDTSRSLSDTDYRSEYNILINEKAVNIFGLGTPGDALGKTISGQEGTFTIVGVVGDHLLRSAKEEKQPMYFAIDEQGHTTLALRFQTNDVSKLLADIDTVWSDVIGARPIRREFMDDRIAALYRTEQQQGQIFALFSALAVLVSCVGLYGLVSFSVARREKEIGVRKVLGATTGIITRKIIWDFSKPVLIANVFAWPIAAYLMQEWLTNFSYRMELSVLPFLGAAAIAFIVASLTVSGHAVRVASANPILALRSD